VATDLKEPCHTPLQVRRRRNCQKKERQQLLQQQIQEDLNELETDPFRQGNLNLFNSADTPVNPNYLEELARRYLAWYQ